jgi:4-hydroxy-tetrahydrodipicolinate reductase
MPIKLCIHGVAGRMGRRLAFLAAEDADLSVVAATEYPGHPWIGRDLGEQLGLGASGVPVSDGMDFPADTDAIIDFSFAEVAVKHGQAAAVRGLPFVLGTTGLTVEQKKAVDALAERLPLLHAANFSVGVAVLCKAAALVAETLGDEYQIEIVEAHHDQKTDAPSGTALRLAEVVTAALARDLKKSAVYGRQGPTGARSKTEIGIHAIRLADIVGEHTVYFGIGGERLELTHKASSRDTFARGALRAAKWLVQNKKVPGRYTMEQVLGLA